MKKYIAPEVEIKKFNVENIMATSAADVDTTWDGTDNTGINNTTEITYNQLFGL